MPKWSVFINNLGSATSATIAGLRKIGFLNQLDIASQIDAEAATDNTKVMTPLRTKQAIDYFVFGSTIGLERYKTASNTWGQAWNLWVAALIATGKKGTIPVGSFDITGATTTLLTARVTIEGAGRLLTNLYGTNLPTLFNLGTAGLSFRGATLTNGQLLGSLNGATVTMTADIDCVEIRDFAYSNTTQRAIFVFARWSTTGKKIKRLILDGIYGTGGLCVPQFICAIESGFYDHIACGDVTVANDNAYFNGNSMLSSGFNGLIIGDDNADLWQVMSFFEIGNIYIYNIRDNRIPKVNDINYIANCQAVRICGHNVSFDSITVKNVSSYYKIDTCGLYHKVVNLRGGNLILENAGNGQASWTNKGYTASDTSSGDNNSKGYNVSIATVSIVNTDGFVGRPAMWLGIEDVYVGDLFVQGCGGDVENPLAAGTRWSGQGGIIYCAEATQTPEDHPRSRLNFQSVRLVNCVIGAPNTDNARAITVDGYKNVYFGNLEIHGLSNAGLFSTQTAGQERPMYILDWRPSNTIGGDRLEVARMVTRDTVASGKQVSALVYSGSNVAHELRVRRMNVDAALYKAINIFGSVKLDYVEIQDCDFSAVTDPVSISGSAKPLAARIFNNRGYLEAVAAYTPGTLTAGQVVTTTVTVAGLESGDYADVYFSLPLQGVVLTAWVSSFQTVTVQFYNPNSTSKTLAAGNIRIAGKKLY